MSSVCNQPTVNHGAKRYVNDIAHPDGVEKFLSHLTRGIDSIYHWVSKTHLQSYVADYALRFHTRKMTTNERLNLVVVNVSDHLIYK